ncbi:MAG TPA: FHA domain-containing protein [Gemmatimonadales bacterium]|nr:FHA domain-containing protein [Gemmatimonadales bacterium]
MAAHLFLLYGGRSVPLERRAVAVGRLPDCDVVLDGWEVSRRHARLVPTPAGPLLVDRSRFGTFVNNLQVVAPLLLADGDLIRIGAAELRVSRTPAPGYMPRSREPARSRLAGWWRRYGVSEIGGAIAALIGALWALADGKGVIWAALAATLGELIWFYLSLALRDLRYEWRTHRDAGKPFTAAAAGIVLQNLSREFGLPEALDLLVRPLSFGLGLGLVGGIVGVLLGKLVADLVFYGPLLALGHWRTAQALAPDPRRLRPTAAHPPLSVGQLAELKRAHESDFPADSSEIPPTLSSDR